MRSFPLRDWILDHMGVRHNLGLSGMVGVLASVPKALASRPAADPARLRARLARLHGVAPDRVFLTHGATEANTLALLYLAQRVRLRTSRAPRIYVPTPEYPPIPDAAEQVGFARARRLRDADAIALSSPRNPEGTRVTREELHEIVDRSRPILLDRTFREFTLDPPETREDWPALWLTGSFTKAYGGDDLRSGYVVAPAAEADRFAAAHGILLDQLPPASVSGSLAMLDHRSEILAEVRELFRSNLAVLREEIDDVPPLAGPVWFDRLDGRTDGERFSRRLLSRGVLVCPGSYFGEPRGVRICLTRRSFPADLAAYLRSRRRFVT